MRNDDRAEGDGDDEGENDDGDEGASKAKAATGIEGDDQRLTTEIEEREVSFDDRD